MKDHIKSHIPVLDCLRAFAALSVCLYHFVCTTTGYIKNDFILELFSFGKYGVHTFFVISGFVIPWAMFHSGFKIINFFSFLLKRLARLEPPYLFSLCIAISLLVLRNQFYDTSDVNFHLNFKQIALHIGYLIPFFEGYSWLNEVYWTLAIEFQYYFFIAILFIPIVKSTFYFRLIIYTCVLALSFFGNSHFLLFWLPVFLLGILLFLFKSGLILKMEYVVITLISIGLCLVKYPIGLVFFSILPIVTILFFSQIKIFILSGIGKFSYSIYLIHTLIGASFINVLSHRFDSSLAKFFVIFAGLLISIFCAWIVYLLIEKPSKKLSSSIKYKTLD